MNTTEDTQQSHEEKDADVVSLFTIVLMLALMVIVTFIVVAALLHYFSIHEPPKTSGQANIPTTGSAEFPQPRLEVVPGADLQTFHAAEQADLNSYGWIDRARGTVRIPIDRAMQLILERGLPDAGHGQTPLSLMQARPNETASPPRLAPNP